MISRGLKIVKPEHIKPLIVAEWPIIFIFKNNEFTNFSNIIALPDVSNLVGSHEHYSELLRIIFFIGDAFEIKGIEFLCC